MPLFSYKQKNRFSYDAAQMIVNVLVFQMTSNDKDFRFMATNDLMTELQKDSIKLDDDSERKVHKTFLVSVFFSEISCI